MNLAMRPHERHTQVVTGVFAPRGVSRVLTKPFCGPKSVGSRWVPDVWTRKTRPNTNVVTMALIPNGNHKGTPLQLREHGARTKDLGASRRRVKPGCVRSLASRRLAVSSWRARKSPRSLPSIRSKTTKPRSFETRRASMRWAPPVPPTIGYPMKSFPDQSFHSAASSASNRLAAGLPFVPRMTEMLTPGTSRTMALRHGFQQSRFLHLVQSMAHRSSAHQRLFGPSREASADHSPAQILHHPTTILVQPPDRLRVRR